MRTIQMTNEQKFEALKIRYEDHVELLRMMTKLDFEIFGGYMAIQLAFGSWLATQALQAAWGVLGLLLVDGSLALIASILLRNNKLRRIEAIQTLKNVMKAIGYYEPGLFLDDEPINPTAKVRFWGPWYIFGVITSYVGIVMLVLSVTKW